MLFGMIDSAINSNNYIPFFKLIQKKEYRAFDTKLQQLFTMVLLITFNNIEYKNSLFYPKYFKFSNLSDFFPSAT